MVGDLLSIWVCLSTDYSLARVLVHLVTEDCPSLCIFCSADRVLKLQHLRQELVRVMEGFRAKAAAYGIAALPLHETAEYFLMGRVMGELADAARELEGVGAEFRPGAFLPMFSKSLTVKNISTA